MYTNYTCNYSNQYTYSNSIINCYESDNYRYIYIYMCTYTYTYMLFSYECIYIYIHTCKRPLAVRALRGGWSVAWHDTIRYTMSELYIYIYIYMSCYIYIYIYIYVHTHQNVSSRRTSRTHRHSWKIGPRFCAVRFSLEPWYSYVTSHQKSCEYLVLCARRLRTLWGTGLSANITAWRQITRCGDAHNSQTESF